jgi:hypothetical protein
VSALARVLDDKQISLERREIHIHAEGAAGSQQIIDHQRFEWPGARAGGSELNQVCLARQGELI